MKIYMLKNVNSEQMIAYNPEDVLAKATEYFKWR